MCVLENGKENISFSRKNYSRYIRRKRKTVCNCLKLPQPTVNRCVEVYQLPGELPNKFIFGVLQPALSPQKQWLKIRLPKWREPRVNFIDFSIILEILLL